MTIQLNELTLEQLTELRLSIDKEIASRKTNEANALVQLVQQRAAQLGVSVEDLLSIASKKGGQFKPTGVAKYANPSNPADTWTGKGRKPLWFIAALEEGKSAEELEIR
ncbi:H-NS histone family protein [Leeia sp. TBRC 13508]|uniref:H-NS histone family protein n=1 Tax=Leeia speluncae TaxID=2884804 RepID=A0ABS8D615_9NEIS|nr:H-NS histone family protein [Leeia speluncae]MCB6183063.1 H-NS histone family protein [Leeia speluncae]